MDKKMDFNEFTDAIVAKVREYLPETFKDATVDLQTVTKNNELKLTGLVIRAVDSSIAPTIYLDQYYKRYSEGEDITRLIKDIVNVRIKNELSETFDITQITDFEKAQSRIVPKLIGTEHNKELLENRPHKIVADLAVTYHIILSGIESASTPVTNQLMENWGVDVDTLHELSIRNMRQLRPSTFDSMGAILGQMMGPMDDMAVECLTEDNMMYVISNKDRLHGAAAILDPYIMETVENHLGTGFYILPSSLHEVIVIPAIPDTDIYALKGIVKDVNDTQVSQEELLSYNVYSWSKKEGLKIVC